MRSEASILHLDLDAFYASVEQRDKPSLRGKPVVVGGVGPRSVVATASYEARAFGIRSAMPTSQARRLCPHAAFLAGRFYAYRASSQVVMGILGELSPLVEPLSLDEAFVDLAAGGHSCDPAKLGELAHATKRGVFKATGLTASVGIGTSKLVAKIASDLDKPDGAVVVAPGLELDLLGPMPITALPGVGPATAATLTRLGVTTVADLRTLEREELVRALGQAHGQGLYDLARARDCREVEAGREAKSISMEDTYETDLRDRTHIRQLLTDQARKVAKRLASSKNSARTVTIKVRFGDFSTVSRSSTLTHPTDEEQLLISTAQRLAEELDLSGGIRLLGVGVSGLNDWVQDQLFGMPDQAEVDPSLAKLSGSSSPPSDESGPGPASSGALRHSRGWSPGADIAHSEYGRGWVWGSGRGVVTVRFEDATSGPGPVRSFKIDDPELSRPTHHGDHDSDNDGSSSPPPSADPEQAGPEIAGPEQAQAGQGGS